jgi:hypothetical protein
MYVYTWLSVNMQTSLVVAIQLLGFGDIGSVAPADAFSRLAPSHVYAVARDYKLHVGTGADMHVLSPTDPADECDDEEKLRILNRALMSHGIFIDRVRPELDAETDLTASACIVEPGWRLEPMP